MRKHLVSVAAAVTMTAGVVATAGTTANAVEPYPNSVPTSTNISSPDTVERGQAVRFRVNVGTQGNADPKGRVVVVVKSLNGEFKWTDTAWFSGDPLRFRSDELMRRGRYLVKARFDAKPGSVWKDSDNVNELRVVRRG